GVSPLVGRSFTPEDDQVGAPPVVMLGASTWESRYQRDPSILERGILVNGESATVIGIVPDASGFPSTATVWLPLAQLPGLERLRRDARSLRVFGRLRHGVSESDARADVQTIFDRLAQEFPQTNTNISARVLNIDRRYMQPLAGPRL